MKTPKRKYDTSFLDWGDETYNILSQRKKEHLNRWKRKNRVAQLKRSLHRYRDATNLPFYCHEWHAYKRLQDLRPLGKKASAEDLSNYIFELRAIRCHISQAVNQAERAKEKAEEKGNAAATHKPAENGQQTNIPPTGGQQTTHP